MEELINKVHQSECLQFMQQLPDNSVDLVLTDPPYGLGFMGKEWDALPPGKEVFEQCLRILKPGGYLFSFGGTRTYHRMAVAIEDAGFEIRDMIEWVYGSGFPKSLNVGVAVNKLETKEWSNISKALDNIGISAIIEVWKNNSNNVKIVATQSEKSLIEIGMNMLKSDSAQENAMENLQAKNSYVSAIIAELNLCEALLLQPETKELIAIQNVEANTKQLQDPVKSAELLSQSHNHKSLNIFTAECDVKEWLNENTGVSHKADEALKTLRGNKKYSSEEIINVLNAVILSVLKHTILNQSKTFQSLDTKSKMECASAINVIITEYTAENLISNTVAILKSKAVDKLQGNERKKIREYETHDIRNAGLMDKKGAMTVAETKGTSEWEGWGTALKPSHEPICMARKPLAEKTVAENCLKWGTGGINIDESRVGTEERFNSFAGNKDTGFTVDDQRTDAGKGLYAGHKEGGNTVTGRFPANICHDNSEEVRECFPETKSGSGKPRIREKGQGAGMFGLGEGTTSEQFSDSGNASRFFKSIIYQPKASKAERGRGCGKNNHPTVKPVGLMAYLVKMASREGAVVFDPFTGSGTTGVACMQNGRSFIGCEINEDYCRIANARIAHESQAGGELFNQMQKGL